MIRQLSKLAAVALAAFLAAAFLAAADTQKCVRAATPPGVHTLIVVKRCDHGGIVWTP
jgi:hypothetical protein